MFHIFIKVPSQMFMYFQQISMFTVQVSIYSFIVTGNKNLHACIQFNVHSGSTSVCSSFTVAFLFKLSKNHLLFILGDLDMSQTRNRHVAIKL